MDNEMKLSAESLSLHENDTESSEGLISTLNNDCLFHIFSFLNKRQLIQIERVCKMWFELSKRSWQSVKVVDLVKMFHNDQLNQLNVPQLQTLLLKCGENLSYLDISACTSHLDAAKTCQIIGEHCKNLKYLCIAGLSAMDRPFPAEFINLSKNLLSLDMNEFRKLNDQLLTPLLIAAENLEKLLISDADIIGTSLIHLNKKCRYLNISGCSSLHPVCLRKALEGLCNLQVLMIKRTTIQTSHVYLESNSKTLEELRASSARFFFEMDEPFFVIYPWTFPNLRVLDLSRGCINIDLEPLIILCPNLEELDISAERGCWNTFNNVAIKKLAGLKKLKILRMDWQKDITSGSLEYLAEHLNSRLEIVACRHCKLLTDSGPSRLVALSPNLKELYVGHCMAITDKLVENALASVKLRTNNLPLNLYVTGMLNEEYVDGDRILLKVHSEEASNKFVNYDSESENEGDSDEDYFESEDSDYEGEDFFDEDQHEYFDESEEYVGYEEDTDDEDDDDDDDGEYQGQGQDQDHGEERVQDYGQEEDHGQEHDYDQEQDHGHGQEHDYDQEQDHGEEQDQDHGENQDQEYDEDDDHGQDYDQDQDYDQEQNQDHGQEHDYDQEEDHDLGDDFNDSDDWESW